jgi:hypothetical protein
LDRAGDAWSSLVVQIERNSVTHNHSDREPNPLTLEEKGILSVFRDLGVPAGASVPGDMISYRLGRAGYMAGAEPWKWESAFVSLEVRGLIQPGADPFSAITWRLTPRGHAFVHASNTTGLTAQ